MTTEWMREYWRYRELLYFLVWRDIKIRYKQTFLGVAWAVLQPLLTTVVFFVFFGKLARIPSDGIPYPVFAYTGIVAWTYFATAVANGSSSLVGNAGLLTKVYFPRVHIPAAAVLGGLLDFALGSLLLIVIMAYYGMVPSPGLLLWPLLALPMVMLAMGMSMWLAALNVRYRDIKYVVPFVVQLWMFLTPIIYPLSMVPEQYRLWLALNPMTGLIEAFRAAALPGRTLDWEILLVSTGLAMVIFIVGLNYLRKAERSFADVI